MVTPGKKLWHGSHDSGLCLRLALDVLRAVDAPLLSGPTWRHRKGNSGDDVPVRGRAGLWRRGRWEKRVTWCALLLRYAFR
jgi:hypothetical protein